MQPSPRSFHTYCLTHMPPAPLQRLRAFGADAIMGIALPMPFHDSCGCALSHLLGVPFIDVNGHPMIDAPPTVPQVRHRSGLDIRMSPGRVAEVSPLGFLPWRVFAASQVAPHEFWFFFQCRQRRPHYAATGRCQAGDLAVVHPLPCCFL